VIGEAEPTLGAVEANHLRGWRGPTLVNEPEADRSDYEPDDNGIADDGGLHEQMDGREPEEERDYPEGRLPVRKRAPPSVIIVGPDGHAYVGTALR